MKHRRRTWFSAPLVAVTASCSTSSGPTTPDVNGYDRVTVDGTACVFSVQVHCPKGASCNPPGPRAVECPAGMGTARTAALGPAKPGTVDGDCLLYPEPCADRTCAIPTPCLRQGFEEIAALAWTITPGSDGRCLATGTPRTRHDYHPPIPIDCPPGAAIERANAKAPCVTCMTSPCPMDARPIPCPDVKAP
jgi:hypothetical protein